MNDHDCGRNTSIGVSERSKTAAFVVISFASFQIISSNLECHKSNTFAEIFENENLAAEGFKLSACLPLPPSAVR
jgi:hypothetical protein